MRRSKDPFAQRNRHQLARRSGAKANSWYAAKHAVRVWLADQIMPTSANVGRSGSVYEVYGTGGASTSFWRARGATLIEGPAGDALESLGALPRRDYLVWDVDPYGSPYPAVAHIVRLATAPRLGLFLCDGVLHAEAMIRGPFPALICAAAGWPLEARHGGAETQLKAWVYYHYAEAVARILAGLVAPRYALGDLRVSPRPAAASPRYVGAVLTRTAAP